MEDEKPSLYFSSTIQLTVDRSKAVNPNYCVICQKPDSKKKKGKPACKPTDEGKKSLKRASEIRKDEVTKRVRCLESEGKEFIYHNTNECFKNYTHKKTLENLDNNENISVEDERSTIEGNDKNSILTRSSLKPRDKPDGSNQDVLRNRNCLFCEKPRVWMKNSGYTETQKYRICTKDRAEKLLEAVRYLQDEVFCKVAELNTVEEVYAADLYYHDICFTRYYTHTYMKQIGESVVHSTPSNSERRSQLFFSIKEKIDNGFERGECFLVSDIKDYMTSIDNTKELNVLNRDVKKILIDNYGEKICFAPNVKMNESELVFSSHITAADIATKIKNINILKEAGEILRSAAQKVDFGLNDSFCDAESLRESWSSTAIPDEWLTFYSSLYKIRKPINNKANYSDISEGEEDEDECNENVNIERNTDQEVDSEDHGTSKKNISDKKYMQLYCQFQTTYYTMHHGKMKTPLQVTIAQGFYGKTRSRQLVTTLNHIGVSVSYQEERRLRNLLCQYTLNSHDPLSTPIPSHFSKKGWTMGALDNENFEDASSISGRCTKNYTAQVLFQDASEPPPTKSTLLLSNVRKNCSPSIYTNKVLFCQNVPAFFKPSLRPSLPSTFKTKEDFGLDMHDSENALTESRSEEFLISLIRSGIFSSADTAKEMPTWSGIHALTTTKQAPLMRVGFLPIIPHPVTEYATVRKSLTNFQSVRSQLDQSIMPIFSDEGVFHIVIDIVLNEPETFKDIFPMLGTFHMAKVLLRCAGKYLMGSGTDDALIEGKVFGQKTLNSVLSGSHYVRSLKGLMMIDETLYKLAWEAFLTERTCDEDFCKDVEGLRCLLKLKKRDVSITNFQRILDKSKDLEKEFYLFLEKCNERSELCRYFTNFQKIMLVIKNLVASDRDGNWNLHVGAVSSALPIFQQFDAINYFRYASFYLENIQALELQHPSLFEKFSQGYFVVRDRHDAYFSAVSGDLKLEQSINRFSKGSGGYYSVGCAGKVGIISEFELIFHEILLITNFMHSLTNNSLMTHLETNIHHELKGKKGVIFNDNVIRLFDIFKSKNNPFTMTHPILPLHNFLTKCTVREDAKNGILDIFENGLKKYEEFRSERFIERVKKLSFKITKEKLPQFKEMGNCNDTSLKLIDAVSANDVANAQRVIEICRLRGMPEKEIFSFDLFKSSPLFDGCLNTKSNKSQLITEIEKNLPNQCGTFTANSQLTTHILVDFMSFIRQHLGFSSSNDFGSGLKKVMESIQQVGSADAFHIVFDSYKDISLKDCERIRRASEIEGIDLAVIDESVSLPQQMDKFWVSSANKEKLQMFARDMVYVNHGLLILSGMVVNDEIVPCEIVPCERVSTTLPTRLLLPELDNWVEEADERIIMHTNWCVESGIKRVITLSNDTDTIVLLLRYIAEFKRKGLKELWVKFSSGENKRMIPLHLLHDALGDDLCHILIKIHVLTGNDSLSRIGTKLAALRFNPEKYLSSFGENDSISETDFAFVEEYLVQVWHGARSKTNAKTFDELRHQYYLKSIAVSISDLPPTSAVIKGHIRRSFPVIRGSLTLLLKGEEQKQVDPTLYSWYVNDNNLLPYKNLKVLGDEQINICGCKGKCNKRTCSCYANGQRCIIYCHRKSQNLISSCINC